MTRYIKVFLISLFCLATLPAFADPVGKYTVSGTNPGTGTPYNGTVEVQRNGETYTVVWNVGGTKYVGTALGAANIKGSSIMGPASTDDTALTVSYVSGQSFGLAFYVQQENGQWKGIWAYGGAKQIGTEMWTRE